MSQPPHRPGREQLTHPVPREPESQHDSGASLCCPACLSDVVDDSGCRQNIGLQQLLELLPADRTLAAATAQPVSPRLLRRAEHFFKQAEVPLDTIIPKMPAQLQAEHMVLGFQGRVPIGATPPPQRLLRAAETLPGCPTFDDPEPPTRYCPVVRKSEKVECPDPRRGPSAARWLPGA